ncbi:MAG: hypothetical protein K2X38_25425 [Gemmataceae bacterium]|nr:hypothetical protein [Gemmataceae bacterium]
MSSLAEIERPAVGYVVPFRAEHEPGGIVLVYEGRTSDGQAKPFRLHPLDHAGRHVNLQYNPLPQHILDLMQAYYACEAKVNGALKERDDALARVAEAEGRASGAEGRLRDLQGKTAKQKAEK